MTVKKTARSGGYAAVVARQKLGNGNHQIDIIALSKSNQTRNFNTVVGFNEKDQLQLQTKDDKTDDEKQKVIKDYEIKFKCENISIDDISNCVNIENYPNCENTLVFYVTKNINKEAIALRFENEQDFKRIYFTYKYFKMRNRLTKNVTNYSSSDNLFSKKKPFEIFSNKKDSYDDTSLQDKSRPEYDLMQMTDNDGITHISVLQKSISRFDQPLSLITIRNDTKDMGEIDSVIYTDIDFPTKTDKMKLFQKKQKAPSLSLFSSRDTPKILKGEFVRVNVERSPDSIPKDIKHNKVPEVISYKETKSKKNNSSSFLWTSNNKGE